MWTKFREFQLETICPVVFLVASPLACSDQSAPLWLWEPGERFYVMSVFMSCHLPRALLTRTRSVILSVGSPALAAYSLVLTSLNVRLVYQRERRCASPTDGRNAAKALICLQQIPLELTKDSRILSSILIDSNWSEDIVARVGGKHAWTVAARLSTTWVVIAFLFTLIDSFISLGGTADEPSEGQAVGTLWLWLLCLVIGWLWVPTFTSGELIEGYWSCKPPGTEEGRREAQANGEGGDREGFPASPQEKKATRHHGRGRNA